MAYIGKEPIVGNFQKCDALTASATADYTLQVSSTNVVPESANHMLVSLNGILQAPITSFTVSGSTLSFASALTSSDSIDFVILLGNVLDIGTPSDDTVTLAKMASGTDGNIISYDTSGNPVAVATGTDGQVLTSSGAGAVCAFEDAPAGGKVLQVVEGTHETAVSTTSTSYVTTNLDVAITCAATSSKVLVICMFQGQQSGSDYPARYTIYRAADLDSTGGGFAITRANVANIFTSIAMTVLDSPSSTSELTYTAYMKNGGSGTSTSCTGNSPGRIIAMEIGA